MSHLPDGVTSAEADPLGNRTVLLLLLAEKLLDLQRLVGRLEKEREMGLDK